MEEILVRANLGLLTERFLEERIEPLMVKEMRDEELIRLGVSTIGERIRLRSLCKKSVSEGGASTSQSIAGSVVQERLSLFSGRTSERGRRRNAKRGANGGRSRTWTAQFVCLADRYQTKVPTSTEKQLLRQAGLGIKKIKLESTDDEAKVVKKITSEEQDEHGQIIGFPQLRDCGGFKILHCVSNCKDLTPIICSWAVQDLKANLGAQTKLYLRPVQRSLSTRSKVPDNKSQVKEKCITCQKEFLIRELRQHIYVCKMGNVIESSESDDDVLPAFGNEPEISTIQQSEPGALSDSSLLLSAVQNEPEQEVHPQEITDVDQQLFNNEDDDGPSPDDVAQQVINYCVEKHIFDPVEILRCLQKDMVSGRPLDIVDTSQSIEGVTNFIMINRENVLSSAFEELGSFEDFRPTLEVEFYGEAAEDYGGPRREFFRLALTAIQKKYFSNGIKEHLSDDYYNVGLIMGLSTLQNGKIPKFLSEKVLTEIFQQADSTFPAILSLQRGLKAIGILQVGRALPTFIHLFRQSQPSSLTLKQLTHLLPPNFSENGSNKRRFENDIYSFFCKYLREAADFSLDFAPPLYPLGKAWGYAPPSGKRGTVTLGHILHFATGTDEEPLLGFNIQPSIQFFEAEKSFLPEANTCINCLRLPCGSLQTAIPDKDTLFNLYDYAFTNAFFGNR